MSGHDGIGRLRRKAFGFLRGKRAQVVKLENTLASGANAERLEGSNPSLGIII